MPTTKSKSPSWVVVTGGGTGIGRALVHHFSRNHKVLTCGRRSVFLLETKRTAPCPAAVELCECDIGTKQGRQILIDSLPKNAKLKLLVQNAAIGDPAPLQQLDIDHFEHALVVNVVAPLALAQAFLPNLKRGEGGRILHLGTSVAHQPQPGTATYGVSKMAFHRLYRQLNAEGIVPVGSLSPGLVDTEGVRDHVTKARAHNLPHVQFFDKAFAQQWTTPVDELMQLVDEVLAMDAATFVSKEWRFSEWRKERKTGRAYAAARGLPVQGSRARAYGVAAMFSVLAGIAAIATHAFIR